MRNVRNNSNSEIQGPGIHVTHNVRIQEPREVHHLTDNVKNLEGPRIPGFGQMSILRRPEISMSEPCDSMCYRRMSVVIHNMVGGGRTGWG